MRSSMGMVKVCLWVGALTAVATISLTGCGSSATQVEPVGTGASIALQGKAYGGQSPVSGSSIYLFAAGTGGYGAASASLLQMGQPGVTLDLNGVPHVTTDGNGSFTIAGDYVCPSASTQVFAVALGGNPGIVGTVNNSALGEIVAFGNCGNLLPSTFLIINEVSTVAAVGALAPFMGATPTSVGTSATNTQGLSNAFVTSSNLASSASGVPNRMTPSGLGMIPVAEIDTLADVLSACVNTASSSSTACTTLFAAATPPGGSAPTNTLQAMLNIARFPAQNVGGLYSLVTPAAPFQPTLTTQPNDWTLAIVHNPVANVSYPSLNYLRIDSQANVWATGRGHMFQLSNAGALNYDVSGQNYQIDTNNGNQVLAVDLNDNVWIDDNSYSVSEVTRSGLLVCAGTYYCDIPGAGTNYASVFAGQNYLSGFGGIAIDGTNTLNVGTAGTNTGLVKVDQNGFGLSSDTAGGILSPSAVALDASGNIWLVNDGNYNTAGSFTKLSPAGVSLAGSTGFTGLGLNYPRGLAIDAAGDAWTGNQNGMLVAVTNAGTPLAGSPFVGGGLGDVQDVAVDGLGNVWAASFGSTGVAEFSSTGTALSPASGYFAGAGTEFNAVAIDSSGNVWMSSFDAATVDELVGVAAPTVTPISKATKNGMLGTRP